MAEIIETIKGAATSAVKKADETYRATMLKLSIVALQKMLTRQYHELGVLVYKICKSETVSRKEAGEDIAAMTVQIDGTRKRIAVLERRIEDIMGLVHCPDCGNAVKMKNAYCSACGKKLFVEEEDILENENQAFRIIDD